MRLLQAKRTSWMNHTMIMVPHRTITIVPPNWHLEMLRIDWQILEESDLESKPRNPKIHWKAPVSLLKINIQRKTLNHKRKIFGLKKISLWIQNWETVWWNLSSLPIITCRSQRQTTLTLRIVVIKWWMTSLNRKTTKWKVATTMMKTSNTELWQVVNRPRG